MKQRNTEMRVQTPNTYYCIYDDANEREKWIKFDGLGALGGSVEGASADMLKWAEDFAVNARMVEPELSEDEAYILKVPIRFIVSGEMRV